MTTETSIARLRAEVREACECIRDFVWQNPDWFKFEQTKELYNWYVNELRDFWKLYRAAWRRYLREEFK
jgi:hypothetical protein